MRRLSHRARVSSAVASIAWVAIASPGCLGAVLDRARFQLPGEEHEISVDVHPNEPI
jgi:hypothetical protein